jgi:Tol biopolymer transport system component/predicted Ser/Thr protein kinase
LALAPGTRLGAYEIVALIGSGGMGEVWKARDTRVDRFVAIKVTDSDFTGRFEREARAIAALNHPNICQLYDVGPSYLVMEFVDGTPVQSPGDLGRLLDVATQIAGGLAAAHAAGVIHRDLKPDNILVTRDSRVKILDFGLAKWTMEGDGLATIARTTEVSRIGTIVGTASYMSPEQARGQVLDARSDQFSFGLILYELAGGKRAFERPSSAETMAAIIREDPPPLPPSVPPPLVWTIERCLAKDPTHRYASTADLFRELSTLRVHLSRLSGWPTATTASRTTNRWLAAVVIGAVALALGMIVGVGWQRSRIPVPRVWAGIRLGGPRVSMSPRSSPDGQLLAFIALADGNTPQLGVMKIGSESWTLLTQGFADGYIQNVCWSLDGSKLYFDRYLGKPVGIYTIPALGGEPVRLLENAFEPQPLPDGSLLVLKRAGVKDQIIRFWPENGKVQPLPAFVENVDVAAPMSAFPDGRQVAFYGRFAAGDSTATRALYVLDLQSGTARKLDPGATIDDRALLSLPLAVSADGATVITLAKRGDLYDVIEVRTDGAPGHRVLFSLRANELPWYIDAGRDGSLYLDQVDRPYWIVRLSPNLGAPELFPAPVIDLQQVLALPDGRVVLSTVSGRSRVLIGHPGSDLRPLLQTNEETASPLATAGPDAVAMLVGTDSRRRIAIASVATGQIMRELPTPTAEITALAVSPDRTAVYYVADGSVFAAAGSGPAKRIGEGDAIALDPSGRYLYAKQVAREPICLIRIDTVSGRTDQVPLPSSPQLTQGGLSPTAVDARQRILVETTSPETWFYSGALLDTATGRMASLPRSGFYDCMAPGWTVDGSVVCAGAGLTGSLWRYHAE